MNAAAPPSAPRPVDPLWEFGLRLIDGTSPDASLPRWPDLKTQTSYTGASGEELLRRTVEFVQILRRHVPALGMSSWKGLDYGVGWGRIASLMLYFGDATHLDCVDAWQKSLDLAAQGGLRNELRLTGSKMSDGDLPAERYDFAYAYSIFTHLPSDVFLNNLRILVRSLKPGGLLLFTVREPRFLQFLERTNRKHAVTDDLERDGYWFGNAQSETYGDTVVDSRWLRRHVHGLGHVQILGPVKSEPFQAIVKLEKTTLQPPPTD